MPVFFSPEPQTLRARLSCVGSAVFANNRTADKNTAAERDNGSGRTELGCHLPLQMLLYFNLWFFPCWLLSAAAMLHMKVGYYQALLVSGLVLVTGVEAARLYLGWVGNLTEKVPELASFWLLSVSLQLPVLLFFLTDAATLLLPLERAVHGLLLLLLLAQTACSLLALRAATRNLTLRFHMQQLREVEGLHPQHHQNLHLHQHLHAWSSLSPPPHHSVLPAPW